MPPQINVRKPKGRTLYPLDKVTTIMVFSTLARIVSIEDRLTGRIDAHVRNVKGKTICL